MGYYKDHFMNYSEDGLMQRRRYMDVYMPHAACKAIGQLIVSYISEILHMDVTLVA